MTEPTALDAWALVDISPPYTAFDVLAGQDTKTTAPSGTESIIGTISNTICRQYRYPSTHIVCGMLRAGIVQGCIFHGVGRPDDFGIAFLAFGRPHAKTGEISAIGKSKLTESIRDIAAFRYQQAGGGMF